MEELQVNFSHDDDPTLVELNDKDKNKLLQALQKMSLACSHAHQLLSKGELDKGFADTICSSVDFYATDIHTVLDYDSKLVRDKEERYKDMRILNEQNRELRKQLGERVHNDDVRERMKLYVKALNKWWSDVGCGYLPKIRLDEYCLRVETNFNISGIGKEKAEVIEILKSQGVVVDEKKERVADCDINRKWFEDLVVKTFPSATVFEFKSYAGMNKSMKEAEFWIRNLDDLGSIMAVAEVGTQDTEN